ncbi:MAG TPA: coniferyl aldehyde dehydrogenase [Burkholderiaceae bacterium]|nr:coniferyl aldehyde dehydrogenase [Burkholderiaceae bacterium]
MNPLRPASPEYLATSFAQQHAASRTDPMTPLDVRLGRLRRLRELLLANEQAIAQAISADFGNRSTHETQLLELVPSLATVSDALRHTRRWMKPRRRRTALWYQPGSSRLLPQPLGVVGIVVPWNYPLSLTIGPLAAAFSAGNRAMVKLSETTPAFGALFERLVGERFAADELVVVNGDASVAQAFCALPFDHLLFTGSTAIGRHVMRAASANLTPVTLELGGKSPAIIGPGADFERAVERVMFGKLMNAGQTCIAPDYVLLPAARIVDFVEAARRVVARMYPAIGASADYTRIVDGRHFALLQTALEEAVARGAHAHPLTAIPADAGSRLMPPVLVTDPPEASRLMSEEIFGPLLPVIGYASIDEALRFVNDRPRPLALYVFERDAAVIDAVLARTVAGGVTINDTLLHFAQEILPFGGVGPSGMGSYHGEAGFETFSHLKPVFRQARFNGLGLFTPPYGPRFEKLVKLLMRRV